MIAQIRCNFLQADLLSQALLCSMTSLMFSKSVMRAPSKASQEAKKAESHLSVNAVKIMSETEQRNLETSCTIRRVRLQGRWERH